MPTLGTVALPLLRYTPRWYSFAFGAYIGAVSGLIVLSFSIMHYAQHSESNRKARAIRKHFHTTRDSLAAGTPSSSSSTR
jgi:hypothetical protein